MAAPEFFYDRILGAGRETDGPDLGTSSNPFPSTGLYIYSDDNTKLYQMQVDNTGAWIFTDVTPGGGPVPGNPIGLLLSLTYT